MNRELGDQIALGILGGILGVLTLVLAINIVYLLLFR